MHPSAQSQTKRVVDAIGGIFGLLCLSLLFIPIALAIKLDSEGPIFFTQPRVGLRGQVFRIRKFRSMVVNADHLKATVANEVEGPFFKSKSDPRITVVGKCLRRTSLDEIPQFWNVLIGDMSLVGTRPPTIEEVTEYTDRHWQRLNVKPGLTGEWQVHGRSDILDFDTVVDMDLRYQDKWSIAYDFQLMIQTVMTLLTGSGAY